MSGKYKEFQERDEIRSRSSREKELSLDELEMVSGGVITEQGAAWLTDKIRAGKTAGSTKENVAFYARFSAGKGDLAHATGEEAEQWVLNNWDIIQ